MTTDGKFAIIPQGAETFTTVYASTVFLPLPDAGKAHESPAAMPRREHPAPPLLFLLGPTAVGKTDLALALAEELGCEIVGVDSMQIYRHLDIGTAKPSLVERGRVPHHLIDYVGPDEDFSAARFVADCQTAIGQIRARGRIPLLAGGTGLYFKAWEQGLLTMVEIPPPVRQGLREELAARGREELHRELAAQDPESAARIHVNDTHRLLRALEIIRATGQSWSRLLAAHQAEKLARGGERILKIGLRRERDELYRRIETRVEGMLKAGLLTEVENLLQMGYTGKLRPMQSLGYRHMLAFLAGELDWRETGETLARDTRRYAKRQLTWFGAETGICWFHPRQEAEIKALAAAFLDQGLNGSL